ncbi:MULTISPECIES: putative pterin-binding protein [Serratia]|uniref:oxidoreductase n=1 Tax=Serratia TaxID=613 RepID=UPI0013299895|nr:MULTISPECIES: oxidoreductase [Serratia]MBH2991238.1 oxidoreductase [Serratia ureilytica]MBN5399885.1 oxidoreductase [Serratia ureilytica]MCB4216707.1 oxidoreductase [Serratia ureilytica]MXS96227.1 oxidoreductase [Serratia marcescens]QHJ24479.1 oxidoreductase [Serratia marcescens]
MKIKGLMTLLLLSLFSAPLYAVVDSFYLKPADGEKIKVTRQMLEAMPSHTIKTSTNFTPEEAFTGVEFSELVKAYHLQGKSVRAFAWDDYSYSMPIDEMIKYRVIVAYLRGGKPIDVGELGPFAIIYPRDQYPELNNLDVNAKTVWQVKRLEIK